MKILFLAHRVPFPPDKGDKIRSFHFLRHLAQHHDVWLGAGVDAAADMSHLAEARSMCRDVYLARLGPVRRVASMAVGALMGAPLSVSRFSHPGLGRWIGRILREVQPDVVLVYSSALAQYVIGRTSPKTRLVIDFVDADAEKWRAYAVTAAAPVSWVFAAEFRRLVRFERRALAAASSGILISQSEREVFAKLMPGQDGKLRVISNGVAGDPIIVPAQSSETPLLVLCGRMDYRPNIEGAGWFAREILPKVRAACPGARFRIVGAAPSAEVRALAGLAHVEVTGAVADVRTHLAEAAVVVVPLRIARGVQNKLLEGLASGRPVVSTPQALEGVAAEPGQHLLVAGDADGFADAVLAVLQGRAPANLGARGRAFVLRNHRWATQLEALDDLLREVPRGDSGQAAA